MTKRTHRRADYAEQEGYLYESMAQHFPIITRVVLRVPLLKRAISRLVIGRPPKRPGAV